MSSFGPWQVDNGRNNIDPQHWHVYRGRWNGVGWDYDRQYMSRTTFPTAQDYLNWLHTKPKQDATDKIAKDLATYNPFSNPLQRPAERKQIPRGQGSWVGWGGGANALMREPIARSATAMPERQYQRASGVVSSSGLKLDSSYEVLSDNRARLFFRPGRCFKTPKSESDNRGASSLDQIYSEVLRMIVVQQHVDFCVCVAVHTYGGRGAAGKRPQDHMVVYVGDNPPALLPGEDPALLARKPVQVRREPPEIDAVWKDSSRINLARLHSISFRSAVRNCGTVSMRTAKLLKRYSLQSQGSLPAFLADREEETEEVGEDEEEQAEERPITPPMSVKAGKKKKR